MASSSQTSPTRTISDDSIVNHSPVYYGWVVWLVSTLTLSASMPGQTASVSLFIDRWIVDFGLDDRSTISALYGAGTFVASLSLTFIGNRLDRYGARVMGVIVALIFAAALVYMSFVNGLVMLAVGFFMLRLLGQGALSLIGTTAVANWFVRLRGRSIALTLIGFGLFQRIYIPFVQQLLERFAWETVFLFLAGALAFVVAPLIALFMRERPERFGVLPDGVGRGVRAGETDDEEAAPAAAEDSYSLREAMGTVVFWVFLLGGTMTPTFITGVVFHQESIFAALGFDATTAANAVANAILLSAFVTLPIGWLLDSIRPGIVRGAECAALVGVLLLTIILDAASALIVWSVLFGMVMGSNGVFNGTVWANLFGRAHLGEIRGFVSTVQVIGTAIGPVVLASSFDLTGGYTTGLLVAAAITAVPMVVSPFMRNPREREHKVA